MNRILILATVCLWAASAAAHSPDECRTTLANFARHAEAFKESMKVTRPILDRLFTAYDEVVEADNHALRHAVIYRHFVANFPLLRSHLSEEAESSSKAMHWAARAIFCLKRDQ